MPMSWVSRKCRLAELLNSQGDEDADGIALDRLLHGQNVIGKTSKTTEIEDLRFHNKDLRVLGALDAGQFGVIDVVNCRLDGRVYVRKIIQKRLALRASQISPQSERDILLLARKSNTPWVPHLLCAYQTDAQLSMLMTYEEGGNMWNVLESSPLEGRVTESDLSWWIPQMVSAISWCHASGFAHRDIKPHNFVIASTAHVKLIDFGSVAPFDVLYDDDDGGRGKQVTRMIPAKYCTVPCGTCDYVSPEILKAHEEALVALELDDAERSRHDHHISYGVETDWWSFGAMVYEMVYGDAPFFAREVSRTYLKILDHQKSLKFTSHIIISSQLQDFLRRLLTHAEFRLGRATDEEVMAHPFFAGVDWERLESLQKPVDVHTPEFEYLEDEGQDEQDEDETHSQGFAFSALFRSSSPGISLLTKSPPKEQDQANGILTSSFIGFSWGPPLDAFPAKFKSNLSPTPAAGATSQNRTPRPQTLGVLPSLDARLTPGTSSQISPGPFHPGHHHNIVTPMRPSSSSHAFGNARHLTPYQTLPRSNARVPGTSTIRKRAVSEKEAMKQLVNCVGMSARKKVLDSGKKPRVLGSSLFTKDSRNGGALKDRLKRRPSQPDFGSLSLSFNVSKGTTSLGLSTGSSKNIGGRHVLRRSEPNDFNGASQFQEEAFSSPLIPSWTEDDDDTDLGYSSNGGISSDETGDFPPSPTPSPRPGSALSRRSATPTLTGMLSGFGSGMGMGSLRSRSRSNTVSSSIIPTPTSATYPTITPFVPSNDSIAPTFMSTPRVESRRRSSTVTGVVASPSFVWSSKMVELQERHQKLLDEIEELEGKMGRTRSKFTHHD